MSRSARPVTHISIAHEFRDSGSVHLLWQSALRFGIFEFAEQSIRQRELCLPKTPSDLGKALIIMLDAGFVKLFAGYPTTRATSMLLILWLLDGDDVFRRPGLHGNRKLKGMS